MRALIALLVVPFVGVTAYGHHSFAALYDESQIVSVVGSATEFEYRSPHAWVHITAMDQSGQTRKISAEWVNVTRLTREGITKDTLRPGDWVIITGSPSRTPTEYTMHLKGIDRPSDGWRWGRSYTAKGRN